MWVALVLSAPVWAALDPPKDTGDSGYYDTGDTGDTADSGDTGGGLVPTVPENTYDGHLDGELAYQMAGDEGGCSTTGSRVALLSLALVGLAVGRLRRRRR
jgi:hypothetical protein